MGLKTALTVPVLLLVLSDAAWVHAQDTKDAQQQAPKTKLEAFTGESGVVVLKGYTDLDTIRGNGSATVAAMTFKNAATSTESKGLLITLRAATSYASETSAYIDYDEINGLLAGLDYIAKADTSVTKLANFEAAYSTKGNVKIIVFNNSSGINELNIKVSPIGPGAYFKMSDLAKFRDSIAAAKNILDNPDSAAAKGNRVAPAVPAMVPAAPVPAAAPAPPSPPTIAAPKARPKPRAPAATPSAPPTRLN